MQGKRQASERVVDEVWSAALTKIMKGPSTAMLRPHLGNEIDAFVPQAATASLINANAGFASILYASAYTSAKRNAYLLIRRLGMPPDFFWKFDYWTQERASETLQRIFAKVFSALFATQKTGTLTLTKVDTERGQFEVEFDDCVECSGLTGKHHICFFHAGIFAGIFGSLLDRDLDAVEIECTVRGAPTCKFLIGKRDDREIMLGVDAGLNQPGIGVNLTSRVQAVVERTPAGSSGDLVDIGYYQLLLSSSFLTNLEFVAQGWFQAGKELGEEIAPLLPPIADGDPASRIAGFYRRLRHMDIQIEDRGASVEVKVTEAPETLGPLARETMVPFLCGEMESLLSTLMKRPLHFQSEGRQDGTLLLRFAP